MKTALLIIYSFLLGSIPFGLLLSRMKGIDLTKVGSGNIGATNVLRTAGKVPALLTLLGDCLKGVAAVAVGHALGVGPLYEGILGVAAILGHDFSVFLRFKGGKGVATSLGVILIYMPQAGILTIIIWLAAAIATRYSSLGALISFGVLPINVLVFGYGNEKVIISAVISLLLIFRHSENIKRLLKGTEGRIGGKA